MIIEEPSVSDNALLPISAAATLLQVSTRTLLRHIEAGHLKCKLRKCDNRRVFTGRELKRYWGAQY